MENEHGIYQVGLKVLLRKGETVLLLSDAWNQKLDLPGGRIAGDEVEMPLEKIIAREIREELGEGIVYTLGKPLFQYRRQNPALTLPVLITVYDAQLISGDVVLSHEHSSYQWVNPREVTLQESDFGFGNEECIAMKKYFDSCREEKA